VVAGEGGFEEILPEVVGRGVDKGEDDELDDGDPVDDEGGLGVSARGLPGAEVAYVVSV
jgi:hypothetical protein